MREMLARMPCLKTRRWPHRSRRQAKIFAQSSHQRGECNMPQEDSVVMDDREMRSGIMDLFRGVEGCRYGYSALHWVIM
jgi:ERCC4-type nuclease